MGTREQIWPWGVFEGQMDGWTDGRMCENSEEATSHREKGAVGNQKAPGSRPSAAFLERLLST